MSVHRLCKISQAIKSNALISLATVLFWGKEHKSHSSSCHFIALKKKVEDLTTEEFFKLQKERHKFIINKAGNEAIAKFEEAAKLRRVEIFKTAMGEE
ncbi:hypothetical protein ILYODFUR_033714 [Ilyodon furcidens]|uniref:Uncharacterized protein n=1 Tax=Ilyodon furcidens TaxID=33524 RepID=A0ABV0TFS5_9TELE